MKKNTLLSLIVAVWLSFNVCQAQDSTAGNYTGTTAGTAADSGAVLHRIQQLEKGTANYLRALQQQNDGLVESAMINLLRMKSRYPDLDYNPIISQLRYLSRNGSTQSLRFLAYFTSLYLDDPGTVGWLLPGDSEFALEADTVIKIAGE